MVTIFLLHTLDVITPGVATLDLNDLCVVSFGSSMVMMRRNLGSKDIYCGDHNAGSNQCKIEIKAVQKYLKVIRYDQAQILIHAIIGIAENYHLQEPIEIRNILYNRYHKLNFYNNLL